MPSTHAPSKPTRRANKPSKKTTKQKQRQKQTKEKCVRIVLQGGVEYVTTVVHGADIVQKLRMLSTLSATELGQELRATQMDLTTRVAAGELLTLLLRQLVPDSLLGTNATHLQVTQSVRLPRTPAVVNDTNDATTTGVDMTLVEKVLEVLRVWNSSRSMTLEQMERLTGACAFPDPVGESVYKAWHKSSGEAVMRWEQLKNGEQEAQKLLWTCNHLNLKLDELANVYERLRGEMDTITQNHTHAHDTLNRAQQEAVRTRSHNGGAQEWDRVHAEYEGKKKNFALVMRELEAQESAVSQKLQHTKHSMLRVQNELDDCSVRTKDKVQHVQTLATDLQNFITQHAQAEKDRDRRALDVQKQQEMGLQEQLNQVKQQLEATKADHAERARVETETRTGQKAAFRAQLDNLETENTNLTKSLRASKEKEEERARAETQAQQAQAARDATLQAKLVDVERQLQASKEKEAAHARAEVNLANRNELLNNANTGFQQQIAWNGELLKKTIAQKTKAKTYFTEALQNKQATFDAQLKKEMDRNKQAEENYAVTLQNAKDTRNADLKDCHDVAQKQAEEIKKVKQQLKACAQLDVPFTDCDAIQKDLNAQLVELQRCKSQKSDQATAATNKHEHELTELKKTITGLTKTSTELKATNTKLQAENAGLTKASTELTEEITGLKAENTGLTEEITGLKAENTGLKAENTGLTKASTGLKAANAGLAKASTELETTNTKLTKTSTELTRAKTELKATNTELTEATTGLKATNDKLETANAELETTKTELETAKTGLETTKTELETAITGLTEAITELETANAKLETAKTGLKAENTGLKATNTKLTQFASTLANMSLAFSGSKKRVKKQEDLEQGLTHIKTKMGNFKYRFDEHQGWVLQTDTASKISVPFLIQTCRKLQQEKTMLQQKKNEQSAKLENDDAVREIVNWCLALSGSHYRMNETNNNMEEGWQKLQEQMKQIGFLPNKSSGCWENNDGVTIDTKWLWPAYDKLRVTLNQQTATYRKLVEITPGKIGIFTGNKTKWNKVHVEKWIKWFADLIQQNEQYQKFAKLLNCGDNCEKIITEPAAKLLQELTGKNFKDVNMALINLRTNRNITLSARVEHLLQKETLLTPCVELANMEIASVGLQGIQLVESSDATTANRAITLVKQKLRSQANGQ